MKARLPLGDLFGELSDLFEGWAEFSRAGPFVYCVSHLRRDLGALFEGRALWQVLYDTVIEPAVLLYKAALRECSLRYIGRHLVPEADAVPIDDHLRSLAEVSQRLKLPEVSMVTLGLVRHAAARLERADLPQPEVTGQLAEQLRQMKRLALYLALGPRRKGLADLQARYERCHAVLRELRRPPAPEEGPRALALTAAERAALRAALDEPLQSTKAVVVLLLLNAAISRRENDSKVEMHQVSLEHVLPRQPSEAWTAPFPDAAERDHWQNRLGNLVLVQSARNASMGNRSFAQKRQRFERTAAAFPLTHEVFGGRYAAWDAAAVRAQHGAIWQWAEEVFELG